jgi:hypothetical protein
MDPASRTRRISRKNISKRLIRLPAFFICPVISSHPNSNHNNPKSKNWTQGMDYFSILYETGQFLL